MKNNPQFTAYALGELSEEEKKVLLEQLLNEGHTTEEIEQEAQTIRSVGQALSEELAKDESMRLSVEQRNQVIPERKKNFWFKIMGWGAGAGIVVSGLGIIAINGLQSLEDRVENTVDSVFSKTENTLGNELGQSTPAEVRTERKKEQSFADSVAVAPAPKNVGKIASSSRGKRVAKKGISRLAKSKRAMDFDGGAGGGIAMPESIATDAIIQNEGQVFSQIGAKEKFNREAYDKIEVNPYTLVTNQPLSTFSVDVDTASYGNMRRFLLRGQLPPKDSIRVEEIINYFHYDYNVSFEKHPVGIKVDQAVSPWNKNRKIVRVAMKSQDTGDLTTKEKNLVFLMDVSGSMNSPKKLPLLKDAIKLLVRKLKPTDTISIVVYAGAAGVVLDGEEAKNSVKIFKALDNLSAGGSTNGGAGVIAAYKLAKQHFVKGGVNRVLLATDGDFNIGTTSRSALVDMIEEKAKDDIFLTVLGLGMGNYQDAILEQISNKGNGNYAYIDSMAEANKLFNIDLEKNLTTVAKDVKVQIEFNPNKVKAYKLIGYENRMLKAQDFNNDKKDAGEMGAGHTVTALYEIVLPGEELENTKIDKLKYQKQAKAKANDSDELLTVKVRYKQPTEDKSTKFEVPLKDKNIEFKKVDQEFKFATAVASFGMKLRNDKLAKEMTYRDIENLAKEGKGKDPHNFRQELIELINFAKQVDK